MSNRYAPLTNIDPDAHLNPELEAAFDDPDEEDHFEDVDESHPLWPSRPESPPLSSLLPATYNFESSICDYDQPPPGSPPLPSAHAVPNEYGNSNGIIPVFVPDSVPPPPSGPWWKRTAAAVLPSHYVNRWGISGGSVAGRFVGGGTRNDGVFSNVAAKPSQGIRVQEGMYQLQENILIDIIDNTPLQATTSTSYPRNHPPPHPLPTQQLKLTLYLLTTLTLSSFLLPFLPLLHSPKAVSSSTAFPPVPFSPSSGTPSSALHSSLSASFSHGSCIPPTLRAMAVEPVSASH
jgi:hypothetical protein